MEELKKLLENAGVPIRENDGDLAYRVEDDGSGDSYALYFNANDGQMFVEENGVGVAMAVVGGGGVMDTSIQNPRGLMNAIFAFAAQNDR